MRAGLKSLPSLIPGIVVCVAVAAAATLLERLEARMLGRAWLETLVLAILLGAAVRTAWAPGPVFSKGINFCAKTVLEVAVALLGASISAAAIAHAGWPLIAGIAGLVMAALLGGYAIGRLCGLDHRVSVLTAAGNAICGNSAIAAVAPAIGATGAEVASSIAFTALLGVVVILVLPLALPLLGMTPVAYGTLAGMTVYAVPQVLVAAAPGGALAVQAGTLVKLVRVLMLGPVVLGLSLLRGRGAKLSFFTLVPWFIIAFLALMALRSAGVIPADVQVVTARVSALLTVLAMAALGLGVDLRAVAQAGPRVSVAVSCSLALLAVMAYALIRMLGIH